MSCSCLRRTPAIAIAMVMSAVAIGLMPSVALADTGSPQYDGRIVGYFSALILIALAGYAVFLCVRPLIEKRDPDFIWALLILGAIWAVKTVAQLNFPGFGVDVGSYQAWAARVGDVGPARTYATGYFLDYPPGYLYLLWFAGAISRAIGASGDAHRLIIESPALFADFLLAAVIFAWVRRSHSVATAYIAMLLFALNPATLFDTLVWGQSDSVPTLLIFLAIIMALDSEWELAWALGAIGALVKPQVLMFLPVLGLWTLLETKPVNWLRSAVAFIAVGLITLAPFQIGHAWDWIVALYSSTAGYYHETSVNAFNFMALIGGLRHPDNDTLLGTSYFTIGMSLLVLPYLVVMYAQWRSRKPRDLMFTAFIALFGSFMLAPRMHERYLYPALVFVIPLLIDEGGMRVVFGLISATFLFNLAYVKHALESSVFLDAHDGLAIAAAAINLAALVLAVVEGVRTPAPEPEQVKQPAARTPAGKRGLAPVLVAPAPAKRLPLEMPQSMPWLRIDTIMIALLIIGAAAIRFWRIGWPNEIVFDEVHFVGQARHYLHGEWFLDPHPPLAKLLIALSIRLFGDSPATWRIPNALLGTALVGVTYLLGRRMFASRLTAALAAAFVLGDGLFLVDSRIAVLDITYVTFGAIAFLLLFRFIETTDAAAKRRELVYLGLALGLCLSAKLYIPAVTFLLVAGFLLFVLLRPESAPGRSRRIGLDRAKMTRALGALVLVGSLGAIVYIGVFLPHYLLGWWGGVSDLVHYYSDVVSYEKSVSSATHPYAAPWWSWPLMLRPIAYWQQFPKTGDVATVWAAGNPLVWWGAFAAIAIVGVQAFERPSLSRAFIVLGYLGYLAIWIPIGRTLFLYHYMGSIYLGFFALALVLTQFWEGSSEPLEEIAMLLALTPAVFLPLGLWGLLVAGAIAATYAVLLQRTPYAGKFVCGLFVTLAFALFIYFFPMWVGMKISRSGYYARMWLQGPGLRNWI